MSKTLLQHLEERIFGKGEIPENYQSSPVASLHALLSTMEQRLKSTALPIKQPLEDFVIDHIPASIKEENIISYVKEFYESNGHKLIENVYPCPDINFSKSDQKVGINLSYSPLTKTCIVTVLDRNRINV